MVSSSWISVGHQLQECARKHPLLTPKVIRGKEVPSSLHAGAHLDIFYSSTPQILACLPENKMGIPLKYFMSTWVPPRGTHSTETWSVGKSSVDAEPSTAIVLGAGIHEQRQHGALAQLPSRVMQASHKAPSISTNRMLLFYITGPALGQVWP